MRFAKRLDAVPPYLFAELERKLAEKQREGVDVISLGIGDPDLPTPQPVVDALIAGARAVEVEIEETRPVAPVPPSDPPAAASR